MTNKVKNRITTTTHEYDIRGMVNYLLTFYVAAVRLKGDGPWKLMRVCLKTAHLEYDPRMGSEGTFDVFTAIQMFKRNHAEPDGTVKCAALIESLDAKELEDDAAGKCFVPC